MAQDKSEIPAHSKSDKDARWGHRTPSKREQEDFRDKAKVLGFVYKIHMIADAENEVVISAPL